MFSNIEIFGLDRAAKASGYPMKVTIDNNKAVMSDYERLKKLGSCRPGSGHDSALKGIVVLADLTLTQTLWIQIQRYHFFEIVSSQSKMHRLLQFKIEEQVSDRVTKAAVDNLKAVIELHKNGLVDLDTVMANCPCGLLLTAEVRLSYLQLKSIYLQRRTHRLKEWQTMCDQMETQLPMFLELIKSRGVQNEEI